MITPLPTLLFATRYLECPTHLIEPKIPKIYWYAYKAFIYAIYFLLLCSYVLWNYYYTWADFYIFTFKPVLAKEYFEKSVKL